MTTDRDALIDAALTALDTGAAGYQITLGRVGERSVGVMLDAILPLIADAIVTEAQKWRKVDGEVYFAGGICAADLVRSLGSGQ